MKTKFKTTNDLKFEVYEGSKLPGFEIFKLGQITGTFRVGIASVDVVTTNIGDPEHLVDLVQWFTEVARIRKVPVRFTRVINKDLFNRLVDEFKFIKSHTDTVIKYDFLYASKV